MKELNYGLVGLGWIARVHLLGLRNLPLLNKNIDFKLNLSGLFTTHPEENFQEAKIIGFEKIVDSIEKLLEIENLDLVDICIPNYLHKQQVMLSLQSNKHIYAEKPLGVNSFETVEILQELKNHDVKNAVAFIRRFSPATAQAHSILCRDILGKAHSFRGEIYHSGYLNPNRKITWREEKEKSGGGALIDLGIHMIDLVHFLLGKTESVSAFTDTVVKERLGDDNKKHTVDVDDTALLMLKLQSGAKGTIEASRVAVGNERTLLTIFLEGGSLVIDFNNPLNASFFDIDGKRIYFNHEDLLEDEFYRNVLKLYPEPKYSQGALVDMHLTSLLWFLQSIISGKTLLGLPTFEDAHTAQLVVDSAYKSSLEGGNKIYIKY